MDNNQDIFEYIENKVIPLKLEIPYKLKERPPYPEGDRFLTVEIWKHMRAFALQRGIFIQLVSKIGNNEKILGRSVSSTMIQLKATLPITFMTSALIHEIAHSLLHHGKKYPKSIKEVEAETIAFLVMKSFGIDISNWSFNYIADYAFLDGLTLTDIYEQSKNKIVETVELITKFNIYQEIHEHPDLSFYHKG